MPHNGVKKAGLYYMGEWLLHVEAFMGAWVIIWVWFSGLRTFNVAIFFFGSVCLPGAKKGVRRARIELRIPTLPYAL
jgi:hypothetical protein